MYLSFSRYINCIDVFFCIFVTQQKNCIEDKEEWNH